MRSGLPALLQFACHHEASEKVSWFPRYDSNMSPTGQTTMPKDHSRQTILIIGASRGLGHAMAAEFLKKGWNVLGTVRGGSTRTSLHDLAEGYAGRVEIETLDICEPGQIAALKQRLSDRTFDILFVNAGTTNRNPDQIIGDVSTEEFMHVMHTNALAPMRVIE